MTYYGAQVIHPKTMRPIQSRNIPLYANSFIEPDAIGTIVSNREPSSSYPPVIVVKKNQCLLEISSKDFYFINEEKLSDLFEQFTLNRIKVNMMQNTAMKFLVCTDDIPERLEKLIGILDSRFHISAHHRLELLTVRHYNPQMLDYLKFGKKLYLEERIPNTVQMVLGHLD
jgi:aspartate kinase